MLSPQKYARRKDPTYANFDFNFDGTEGVFRVNFVIVYVGINATCLYQCHMLVSMPHACINATCWYQALTCIEGSHI